MPKALLKIVLLVATVFLCAAQAQQLPIALKTESYGVPEGLSQSTVTSVVEDDDGYIWIGTLNGLNRFDGREFKHFFANDRSGLSSSFIQSLLFDNKTLLVGTDNGLNIYNSELETFKKIEHINEAIWSINDNGDVYTIGTKNKIIEIRKDSLKIIKTHQNDSFNFIKKAIKTNKEYIIRNYDGKIIHYGEDSSPTTLSLNSVDLIKSKHGIYTLSSDGIYKIISNDIPNHFNEEDTLFTVINGQVIQTNLKSLEIKSKGYILDNKEIINQTQVYRTKNYTIIPSLNMGLILIRDSSNIVKSLINPVGNVWSINILDNDRIVTSDDSSEIEIYDSNFMLEEKIDTNTYGPKYITKHRDSLFVGGNNGLYEFKGESKKKILNDNIVTMFKSQNNNIVIVGTSDSDIYIVDLLDENSTKKISLKNKHPIFQILQALDGTILLATQGGLISIDINGNEKIVFNDDFVYCINETLSEYLLGTRTSIFSIDKKTLETSKLYSSNKPIYSIAIDDNNDFIASSIRRCCLNE